jgi:hypothetical protein
VGFTDDEQKHAAIQWARPVLSVPFCAVLRIKDGSVLTYCCGRWSTRDTVETTEAPDRRCGGCEKAVGL